MKKSNVILNAAIASALLAMTGSAFAAATLSATGVIYATEQFSGSAAKASVVSPGTIVVGAGTVIPANSNVTVAIALTNGLWASIPSAVMATSNTSQAGTMSATSSTFLIPLTLGAASSIGVGGTIITIGGAGSGSATFTTTSLAAAGTPISATATVYLGTVTSANLGTSTIYDAASTATTLATSAAGSTLSAAANTSTALIDLTATTPSTAFTNVAITATETGSTTTYKLGRLYILDNGTKVADNGASTYTAAGSANYVTATIAAPSGFFAGLGTTGTITLRDASAAATAGANACSGTASATSAVYTVAASAAAATSVTAAAVNFSGGTAGSGWPVDVCYTISGTVVQVTGTPTIAVTKQDAATATRGTNTLAATNLQALASNGQTKYVRNYVPAAVTGFTEIVRISNTGSLAAVPTIVMKSESGTQIGTSFVGASLAAGATRRYTQAQIETGVGATALTLLSTDRPRLTVTAPTNGLDVQTLMYSNGVYTSLSGTE